MGVTRPPLEYLATCSKVALESFELSRLNEASNFRKEVQQILQGWIDTEVDARLARWVLESKQAQVREGLQGAMAQPLPLKQLDLSFLPSNGAPESDGETGEPGENTRKPGGPKLQRAAHPVLPCADGRKPGEPQKSFGMEAAKLLERRAGAGSSNGSALPCSVRKPAFAQEEEDGLHELEYFVQREWAASETRLQHFAAEAEVRVFPSTDAMPAAVCQTRASLANSISVLERALRVAAADRAENSRAPLNVRTLICRPGLERSRRKAIRPRAVCARGVAPAS